MNFISLCALILASIAFCFARKINPLSSDFIETLNTKNSTWKAGVNFNPDTPFSQIKGLLGVLPKKPNSQKLPVKIHEPREDIPETFDSRDQWPDCAEIIADIRDQANCGSCWAFGAVEAMSDRFCIQSNGERKLRISAEDLNDCCLECGNGCLGGWPDEAWLYWSQHGIVTGGLNGNKDYCKAYSLPSCDHHVNGSQNSCGEIAPTPECTDSCDEGVDIFYTVDLKRGSAYTVLPEENQIQTEILTSGPVEADFDVYEDFLSYKTGVYQHTAGEYAGGHAVKILGWGVENQTPYWLIANSWNTNWGDQGYFRMLRGSNECGIENNVIAGLPW